VKTPGISLLAVIAVVLALALLQRGASGAVGAHQPVPQNAEDQTPRISIESSIVNADVLVTDQDGRVLNDLKKENFRIMDEGKLQVIKHFEPTTAPITVVMLMEYSAGSNNYFAFRAAGWGSAFLDRLEARDYVALVTYDAKPSVRQDFTRNKAEVKQAIGNLSYPLFREANLFDAINDVLDRLDRVKGKKAVLLLSTGANTMSSASLQETLQRIRQSDATIFSVGLAEAEMQRLEGRSFDGSSIAYLQAKNQMESFANLSGGSAWFPKFEGELPSILGSVGTFLRGQYSIGFAPNDAGRDGKYHRLSVEVVDSNGSPLTVATAKGKQRKPIVYARAGYVSPGAKPGVESE
jgi:VWFA-related protein